MKYYKNKKTGEIVKARLNQGNDWIDASESEINVFDLEIQKRKLIVERNRYLFETSNLYSHDWSKAPQDVINKRNLALQEINEIESATQETINNYLTF